MVERLFDVKVESHVSEVLEEFKNSKQRALEIVGMKAEGYAKGLVRVDTGRLKNSITHAVKETQGRTFAYSDDQRKGYSYKMDSGLDDSSVAIGTNVEYAPYQEFGTSMEIAHRPYIKPAIMEHINEYKSIFENELKAD